MKAILAGLVLAMSFAAAPVFAKQVKKTKVETCESLQETADEQCREEICEEMEAEGNECAFEDGAEIALQECSGDRFWELVEKYNKSLKADKQLNCEE